jgi:hypothetical protein
MNSSMKKNEFDDDESRIVSAPIWGFRVPWRLRCWVKTKELRFDGDGGVSGTRRI